MTLTVVDALGTVVSGSANLTVDRPVVGLFANVPQANGTTPAGSPVAIPVIGEDSLGHPVVSYSAPVTLRVNESCGPSWLNDSGVPVPLASNGSANVPASSWSGGVLDLSLSASRAGLCSLAISTGQFPVPLDVAFQVSANTSDLRLFGPVYVETGSVDNATRYSIADEFGNPDLSGYVIVETTFGTVRTTTDSPIQDAGGRPTVWVNYSAAGEGAGTLTVLSERNVALLAVRILGTPAASGVPELDGVLLGALVVGAGAVLGVVATRRRRADAAPTESAPEDPDEPLRRLAEGRSHVLSRLAYRPGDRPRGGRRRVPRRPAGRGRARRMGWDARHRGARPAVGRFGRPAQVPSRSPGGPVGRPPRRGRPARARRRARPAGPRCGPGRRRRAAPRAVADYGSRPTRS